MALPTRWLSWVQKMTRAEGLARNDSPTTVRVCAIHSLLPKTLHMFAGMDPTTETLFSFRRQAAVAPGCPRLPKQASWLASWPSASLSVIQALILLNTHAPYQGSSQTAWGVSRLQAFAFAVPSAYAAMLLHPSLLMKLHPSFQAWFLPGATPTLSNSTITHSVTLFPGNLGSDPTLPWKRGSLGGKTTAQPSAGQGAGGKCGVGGKKDPTGLDHQQPRCGQSDYPQSCHAHGHHTHGLSICPSPPPGVSSAPTSSVPSQGSLKPQIRPHPPQPRASLDLCWSISPHQCTPHGNTCPIAPRLRPPWAPFSPRSSQKTSGVTDTSLSQFSRP